MEMQIGHFGIFDVSASAIDTGEVHTVMTRDQMEAHQSAARDEVKTKAMKGYSFKLYSALAKEAIRLGSDAVIEWTYGTEGWNNIALKAFPKLKISGIDCNYWIDIKEEYSGGSSWRSRPTGKVRVSVGSFGGRTSYPQRKDGTHNYKEIASTLVHMVKGEIEKKRQELQRLRNTTGAAELRVELGVEEYWGAMRVNTSTKKDKPILVAVEIKREMTADEARALHAALKTLGYVK